MYFKTHVRNYTYTYIISMYVFEPTYLYVCMSFVVCVCVCGCVCILIPVSNLYGYTDKFGALVTLEPCNEETRGKLNTDQ